MTCVCTHSGEQALSTEPICRYSLVDVQRDGEEAPTTLPAVRQNSWTAVNPNAHDGGEQYYTFQPRLDTYRRWPKRAGLKPEDLAQEGFYYTGIRDEVRCFTCEQLLRLWRPGEDIRERHRRYSPNCPFLASLESTHHDRVFRSGSIQPSHTEPISSLSQRPASSDDMRVEEKRLGTYRRFPVSCPVQAADLARAGFYFTGRDDGVQCFSCRVALRGWEGGDTAEGEHRRHNPFCPFLNGTDKTNVPIPVVSASAISAIKNRKYQPSPALQFDHVRLGTFQNWPIGAPVSSEDLAETGFFYVGERDAVRCFHCLVQIDQWVPGDVPIDEHVKHSPDCPFARAVAQRKRQYEGYATPNDEATAETMQSYDQRLVSFRDWPQAANVSAESLARAGFYYLGSGDAVRCFCCGGTLKQWQQDDSACEEHAKYFPSCKFVQERHPVPSRSQPAEEEEPICSPLDSTSVNVSDFIQQASSMGFLRDLALRVLEQHDTRNLSFTTYLDALLEAKREADKASLPTADEVTSASTLSVSFRNTPSQETSMPQPTAPPETEGIQHELEKIRESRLCKICMEQEATVLFLPCAHILCCERCAISIHECPVCRHSIQQKIRSYYA